MWQIIIPICIAIATGLTFIAYHHQDTYRKFFHYPVCIIPYFVPLYYLIRKSAFMDARDALYGKLKPEFSSECLDILLAIDASNSKFFYCSFFYSLVYIPDEFSISL